MRSLLPALAILIALVALVLPVAAKARSKYPDFPPNSSAQATMLGERIQSVRDGGTVHIAYLHGMRADGAGHSKELRQAISRRFSTKETWVRRRRVDLGPLPPPATFARKPIWEASTPAETEQRWLASRPFVDRYEFTVGKGLVIIDELNWWPLLHPLKCQFLVIPDQMLSGPDKDRLRLCAKGPREGRSAERLDGPEDDGHYPWISRAEAEALIRARPLSGGGAPLNRMLKQSVLNWGVADAPIVLGTMSSWIRKAIDLSFADINDIGAVKHRAAMTESLGSFVLLDAMREDGQARKFVAQSRDLFFMANQFALLETARIKIAAPKGFVASSDLSPLTVFEDLEKSFTGDERPEQVVAISDPSDILTYVVPDMPGIRVTNIFIRVAPRWWLFTDPRKSHRGAIVHRGALDLLLRTERPR